MNVQTVKRQEPRIDTAYVSRFNLQGYGRNNLYPQDILNIIGASGTAELCLARYRKFIEGGGFAARNLASVVVNEDGDTLSDILHLVVDDIATFGGFALLANYNVLGAVSSVYHLPFEQCRLEEADEEGAVHNILVHPDWAGRRTRKGQRISVDESNITRYPVFAPDDAMQQMLDAGGTEEYTGQVLWCSMAGKWTYPLPIYDAAIAEICTDEGLGTVKYRNVKSNFLASAMLITRKPSDGTENDADGERRRHDDSWADQLRALQGAENALKIMHVELEAMEQAPELVQFPVANFDKDFSVTDASVIERIYAIFHQELFHAIRIGKLGFSGSVMQDAYSYYAGEVTNEQMFIERNLLKVLRHWHDALPSLDTTILPLEYVKI